MDTQRPQEVPTAMNLDSREGLIKKHLTELRNATSIDEIKNALAELSENKFTFEEQRVTNGELKTVVRNPKDVLNAVKVAEAAKTIDQLNAAARWITSIDGIRVKVYYEICKKEGLVALESLVAPEMFHAYLEYKKLREADQSKTSTEKVHLSLREQELIATLAALKTLEGIKDYLRQLRGRGEMLDSKGLVRPAQVLESIEEAENWVSQASAPIEMEQLNKLIEKIMPYAGIQEMVRKELETKIAGKPLPE